ncbi:hypothetical protein N7449_011512 [Penicillium cf. viridicatum]|uniref:Uncharacterized protein n=1 Tax=Penicillium cf. viridicatum TaxID=2972119 RepID=A0A9W9IX79_9EURO|nr:hypothetical protein N7449_011512 [Penicillium cf. viridicatum]
MDSLQISYFHSWSGSAHHFEGDISVRNLPRSRTTCQVATSIPSRSPKPPSHSQPSQWGFFRVLRENLTIEFNGRVIHWTSSDGQLAVPPYTHHVIYGTSETEMNEVEFVVSASDPAAEEEGTTAMDQNIKYLDTVAKNYDPKRIMQKFQNQAYFVSKEL